jgi:hypothetical protein
MHWKECSNLSQMHLVADLLGLALSELIVIFRRRF